MKVKKGDLFVLWHVLDGLKSTKVNVKFSYFIAKNRNLIKHEIDALNEVKEAPSAFKAYDEKRAQLAHDMADRMSGTDQPITEGGQYVIVQNKEKFEEGLKALKDRFSEVIEQRNAQIDSFKELLDEEVDFEGHTILLEYLPDDIEPTTLEVFITVGLLTEDI